MIKLDPNFTPALLSTAVLKEPLVERDRVCKGALVLNFVDEVVTRLPDLQRFYFLVERKGWHGFNTSHYADIKLIEDLATLELTRKHLPDKILLEIANGEFVDEAVFRPLGREPKFDVVQIACWSPRKRIELMIEAAARLPEISFLHLGHFENQGSAEELRYRDACIAQADRLGANIAFPFGHCNRNEELPTDKQEINQWLNQARIGVLTATKEGLNRFKMECMAADRPMLVASDAGGPTQKHINARTGRLFDPTPAALAAAITDTLHTLDQFSPRAYLLEHTGHANSLAKLRNAFRELCAKTGEAYRFDDIDWDGRNERMAWGESAFARLQSTLEKYQRTFDGHE
jgi:glycosyltransferase involved in cell wall biosynthesis